MLFLLKPSWWRMRRDLKREMEAQTMSAIFALAETWSDFRAVNPHCSGRLALELCLPELVEVVGRYSLYAKSPRMAAVAISTGIRASGTESEQSMAEINAMLSALSQRLLGEMLDYAGR